MILEKLAIDLMELAEIEITLPSLRIPLSFII